MLHESAQLGTFSFVAVAYILAFPSQLTVDL